MSIIVFSSNEQGGILQLAIQITEVLIALHKQVLCYIPEGGEVTIPANLSHNIIRYRKVKNIYPYNQCAKAIAASILQLKPTLVWYVDNAFFTSNIGFLLARKTTQILTMHDAGTYHTTYQTNFLYRLKRLLQTSFSQVCNKKIDRIILCSPNSLNTYLRLYPHHRDRVYMLPLGAHLPEATSTCPPEIFGIQQPLLFFGRIDKYKGIDTLLRTYSKWSGDRQLVIAGQGRLLEAELKYIQKDKRIILINRFITDAEMVYLFHAARAILLPYKDATQSGILPIAYRCEKPVICSDVAGITQFVEQNITGFICKTDTDFVNAYDKMEDDVLVTTLSQQAKSYYKHCLEWESNIIKMLQILNLD